MRPLIACKILKSFPMIRKLVMVAEIMMCVGIIVFMLSTLLAIMMGLEVALVMNATVAYLNASNLNLSNVPGVHSHLVGVNRYAVGSVIAVVVGWALIVFARWWFTKADRGLKAVEKAIASIYPLVCGEDEVDEHG